MTTQINIETVNPFFKYLSMEGKKLVKLSDGSYFDIVRNWVYIEKQIFDDYGSCSYDLTMYKPYDLSNFHPVHDFRK